MSTRPISAAALGRALALVVLMVVAAACQSAPTSHGSARFHDCTIGYHDATATMRPYLDEVSSITGMRFVPTSRSAAVSGGLVIESLTGGGRSIGGTTQVTRSGRDERGQMVVWSTRVRLIRGASPGMRRHELGHLFNLAHNPRSSLMQAVPDLQATYSRLERSTMTQMARRSACAPTAFG